MSQIWPVGEDARRDHGVWNHLPVLLDGVVFVFPVLTRRWRIRHTVSGHVPARIGVGRATCHCDPATGPIRQIDSDQLKRKSAKGKQDRRGG